MNRSNIPAIAIAVLCLTECAPIEESRVPEQQPQDFQAFYASDLFKAVQLSGIFKDSKTFVDAIPNSDLKELQLLYLDEKENAGFDLKVFVDRHFSLPEIISTGFKTDTTKSMQEHIEDLWPVLTRDPDEQDLRSSLIPLPNPYIVPGGRFREIYYWDSYFTMEGLIRSGHEDIAEAMVDNFSYLIDTLGFITNGNRTYYLGRSQPPFFSLMVKLISQGSEKKFLKYHEQLLEEYNFWMEGEDQLSAENLQINRVVRLVDGSILNRYWDNYTTPRPESYKEDYEMVKENDLPEAETYRHIRAAAESGWDFSSRWFKDYKNLSTIHTTDIIPVDLNTLMYHLESQIAQGYLYKEEKELADKFLEKAQKRKVAIDKFLWNEKESFYMDYDITTDSSTAVFSLAAVYPLYFEICSEAQAEAVKERLQSEFLKSCGFVTTLNFTEQQWDAPNGWPPLQWLTVNGLKNYGYIDLASEGASRWLDRNREVYTATGKMMEKYDVVNVDLLAGGGEYPLQDGFGWTNGVALAMIEMLQQMETVESK